MSAKPKKLSKAEKKTFALLEDFEHDALSWGWSQDQGTGSRVFCDERNFKASKQALVEHINRLHKQLKDAKASLKHAHRELFDL